MIINIIDDGKESKENKEIELYFCGKEIGNFIEIIQFYIENKQNKTKKQQDFIANIESEIFKKLIN